MKHKKLPIVVILCICFSLVLPIYAADDEAAYSASEDIIISNLDENDNDIENELDVNVEEDNKETDEKGGNEEEDDDEIIIEGGVDNFTPRSSRLATIKNPDVKIVIPKIIILNDNKATYEVGVDGDIPEYEVINITVPEEIEFTTQNKEPVTGYVVQEQSIFSSEVGSSTTGTITADLSAGFWTGNLSFEINIEHLEPPHEHTRRENPDIRNEIAPTCTEEGEYDEVYVCEECGEELEIIHVTVGANGHTDGESKIEEQIDATCTEPGSYEEATYCTICGEETSRILYEIDPLGHDYDDGRITKYATCTEDGTKTFTCLRCEESYEEVIPANGHDWDEGVVTTESTCLINGIKTYTCKTCSNLKLETIPTLEHIASDSVEENVVLPTCTEPGSCDDVTYCSKCGTELERTNKSLDALGHNYVKGICDRCGDIQLDPGVYDEDGNLVVSWNQLEAYGLDLSKNYSWSNKEWENDPTSGTRILKDHGYTGLLVFPDDIDYIGYGQFHYSENLTGVAIRSGEIASSVFAHCPNLKTVIFGKNVTSIGDSAFQDVQGLEEVVISDSVLSIGGQSFYGCKNLKSVKLNNGLKSVGPFCFGDCTSLEFIEFPSTLESIGNWSFRGNIITSVTLSGNLTNIGDGAFANCKQLKTATISKGITSISNSLFSGCDILENVNIADSVTSIGNNAFQNCKNLTSITIPNSVTSIGTSAFSGCLGLTSITIPNSVTNIGENAFFNCKGLTSVTLSKMVQTIGRQAFCWDENIEEISVPNDVQSIGQFAFYNVKHITYNGTLSGSPWGAKAIN